MQPHNDYEEFYDHSEQQLVHHQTQGFFVALSVAIWIFIYLPLLTIGYIVSYQFLHPKDSAFLWIGSVLFFAAISYAIIQKLKCTMQSLRDNGHRSWIVLFLFCVAITCVQTPWIAYQPISHLCDRCHWPHGVAWALDIGIGLIIYRQYDFLGD